MKLPEPPSEGGGVGGGFLKLKDKESATGVFRGSPFEYRQHWVNGRSKPCTGASHGCEPCAQKVPSSYRFRFNFVVNENGKMVAKVFEQGSRVYKKLFVLNKDYPLEKAMVRITRSGSGQQDTTYDILPLPKWEVPPPLEAALNKIELVDLDSIGDDEDKAEHADGFANFGGASVASPASAFSAFGDAPANDDIPF